MAKRKIPVRLILSVVAGIATSAILFVLTHWLLHLAGVFPPITEPLFNSRLLIISLIYHSFYAIIAAYLTSYIAREQAKKAVFILGTKEAIMWLIGTIILSSHTPAWFTISKAVLGPPLAWMGGQLFLWYRNKKAAIK